MPSTRNSVGGLHFELTWRGKVIDTPADWPGPGYLSYPTVMFDDDRYKMWFAGWPHDWIYYAESSKPFATFEWNWREQAVRPGPCHPEVPASPDPNNPSVCVYRVVRSSVYTDVPCDALPTPTPGALALNDSWMTADPCVLRVVIDDQGHMRYYMWYTGTCYEGVHNSIFFAESLDGKVWTKKYRKVLLPTGHVGMCGAFVLPVDPQNLRGTQYGAGQSSVIQLPDRFYHYYRDTSVAPGEPIVRLIRLQGPFAEPDTWPPLAVNGLRTDGNESWDIKYHVPSGRMIAFAAREAAPCSVLISVSKDPISADAVTACEFEAPVQISMSDLGIPGDNMNNGCLLGNRTGWIEGRESAFYCGFGEQAHADTWTIGATHVLID